MNIGSPNMKFRLILEVEIGLGRPGYVAFDDITITNCATGEWCATALLVSGALLRYW